MLRLPVLLLSQLFLLLTPIHADEISPGPVRLPVEAFASLPELAGIQLSPDGKKIAGLLNEGSDTWLVVRALGAERLIGLTKTDNKMFAVNWFRWINNERVAVSVRFPSRRYGTAIMESRLLSFHVDGGKAVNLMEPNPGRDRWAPQFQDRVIDWLPEDGKHILVSADLDTPLVPGVYRVDVETGRRSRVPVRAEQNVVRWLTDRQHRVRVGVKYKDDQYTVNVCDPEGKNWNTAWTYSTFSLDLVEPIGFGSDPNRLYVSAYREGYRAIFTVDLRDPAYPLVLKYASPGNDVDDNLVYSQKVGDYIGVAASDGSSSYIFWHPEYEVLTRGVDDALPARHNAILGFNADESRYLVFSSGNKQPGTYYFGDRADQTLNVLGWAYPQLKPENLAGKRRIDYKARDGLSIPAYLTLPPGKPSRNLPLVVFPHGGPIAEEDMGFDYWSEFFANRGYAVLQMNFRGSAGQGLDFMRAGLRQWGLRMQDDISDGVQSLIDSGVADKNHICIVGASYGGYAALMGAAKTPDLYRCAISFAGVSDLSELLDSQRNFLDYKTAQQQIGDLRADREQLRATSPRLLAGQIKIPVLLVHGIKDRTVPVEQSEMMAKALNKAGRDYRFIKQEDGDHYLSNYENRLQLFREMERFLAEHL